jgi:hypothetical protein
MGAYIRRLLTTIGDEDGVETNAGMLSTSSAFAIPPHALRWIGASGGMACAAVTQSHMSV